MQPDKPLPCSVAHDHVDEYVERLLKFVAEEEMMHILCGGVHILDFLTREPDHFSSILPQDWREWLVHVSIPDLLDLLMREDVTHICADTASESLTGWRSYQSPPSTLVRYIRNVRDLCLDRSFTPDPEVTPKKFPHKYSVGMKPKKAHEVLHFASYIDRLVTQIGENTDHNITHILDFGSGQNYLGRVLASPVYKRDIIAVESRHSNITRARDRDQSSKLAKREAPWRNRKLFKATGIDNGEEIRKERDVRSANDKNMPLCNVIDTKTATEKGENFGHICYVEKRITDGDLKAIFNNVQESNTYVDGLADDTDRMQRVDTVPHGVSEVLVISLHSCGNLLHHGLRSLILNPFVKAVAMVGCCYNLTTERLGPPSAKLPNLRSFNRRVEECEQACDPHGFPMSEKLATYPFRGNQGVRMNITARMMAVQAPQNWTEADCDAFFTRHFYRALLQKVFLDLGIVEQGTSGVTSDSGGEAVTLGSLRKSCYQSFVSYGRGAAEKLAELGRHNAGELLSQLTDTDLQNYWERFKHKKHELCIVWSLMAFSAGVVESLIITDRWLFLREQPVVRECWVETVFDYSLSPRNFVVVGIKD